MPPVRVIVAGAGSRGTGFANYVLQHPAEGRVVGVAEPRAAYRDRLVRAHGLAPESVFTDWTDMAARERFADAVIIATQDAMHADPATAFAGKGYHILLEKPMAPSPEECRRIVRAVRANRVLLAVGHVMRYTEYTRQLKSLLEAGAVGDVVSLQHLEPVGYWHQAHSFVRGNWRNARLSSCMLLAKSCHDLDWIRYIMGVRCLSVSAFGNLYHFRRDRQPAGAADRCLDCSVEAECPYSAKRLYLGRLSQGRLGWPLDVLTPDPNEANVLRALREGPYGRCVYACDNDVVDHQTVNMEFEGGRSAVFTMTAFTEAAHRRTRIFGTRGEIFGDGSVIDHFDFLSDRHRTIDTASSSASIGGGHGGGDARLMQSFLAAVATGDPQHVLSGPEETLESHEMVFAAERARCQRRVVDLPGSERETGEAE